MRNPEHLLQNSQASPDGNANSGVSQWSGVTPNYLLYNSTKGAIEQMTRVMAKELATKGINVNAVAPGPTATELFLKGKSEQLLKGIASGIPFGRIGEPDEVANAIAFLCSNGSSWYVFSELSCPF